MKNKLRSFALLPFMAASGVWAAAPTSGAYVNDPRNQWVQERLAEVMSTPNTVLCFVSKLRADAMVNKGNYIALVDMDACDSNNRGKDNSASTSSGASAAVNYTRVTVNSSRASNSEPMKVKVWFQLASGPNNSPVNVIAYASVTESPSTANPNGVFTVSYCGVPTSRTDPMTGTCSGMQGELSVSGNTITFTESMGGGAEATKLNLTRSDTTGSGRVANTFVDSTGTSQTKGGAFAYDASYFKRGDSVGSVCFARGESQAEVSTWRYGVYKADGSRFDLANPSFPVTATVNGQTYWGNAGFWGIFFPSEVLGAVTQVQRMIPGSANTTSTTYDLQKFNGKLYKMTRRAGVLSDLKGQPIQVYLPPNVVDTSGGQYEITWNSTALQATRKQDPQNPGSWTDLSSSNLRVTAANLRTNAPWQKALQGFSQSVGGEARIGVPDTGEFADATVIATRTREVVIPGSSTAPASLGCVNRCPKGNLQATDFSSSGSPFQTITVNMWGPGGITSAMNSEFAFQPVATSNVVSYTFPSTGVNKGLLVASGNASVDASSLTSLSGPYQHGVQSGRLIDISTGANYSAVRCAWNGQNYAQSSTGNSICPWLVEDADVYYTYETGPNPWNRYIALSSNGNTVTFDPPVTFSFTASTGNTTLKSGNGLIGSVVQLQHNGFGELHGIPGICVDMRTNQPVTCGTTAANVPVRWVPAFSIKDGTELTSNGQSYYVRYLDRELRLAKVADSNCAGLTLPLTATLPGAPSSDARTSTGAAPSVTDAPKVIEGVVQ